MYMDVQTTHDFVAHGEIVRGANSVPATIVGKLPSQGLGNVGCKVSIEDWPLDFGSLYDYQDPLQLKGKTEEGKDIWSPEFQINRARRGFLHRPSTQDRFLLEGVAAFFIEGDLSTFDASKGEIGCIVSVTPTILSQDTNGRYLPNWDGTIARSGNARQGIHWNTLLGEAELLDNYEYLHEKVGFEDVLIRFQKCQITLKIIPQHRETSLRSLIIEVKEILDVPLLLLSFLSRRSITWYEAKATFIPADRATEVFRDAKALHQQSLGYDLGTDTISSQANVPVNLQALKEGAFQAILQSYEGSPLKNTIRQTIQYLLITHESGYFEARLGLVYAALECLVDGLSKHNRMTYLMGSSKFDKLSKKLAQTIQSEVPDESIALGVIAKLPELRRPAIRERLLKLLEIYKLNNIRMSSDLSTALQGILERRNHYIHQGVVDYDKQLDDFYLLQELIELWLLTLLECPDTAINSLAFRQIILAR
jgi:hypothetical protein